MSVFDKSVAWSQRTSRSRVLCLYIQQTDTFNNKRKQKHYCCCVCCIFTNNTLRIQTSICYIQLRHDQASLKSSTWAATITTSLPYSDSLSLWSLQLHTFLKVLSSACTFWLGLLHCLHIYSSIFLSVLKRILDKVYSFFYFSPQTRTSKVS